MANKTKYLKFNVPVRWARVFEDNRDMHGFEGAFEEVNGAYSIEMGMTPDQFKELSDAGSMKKGREGEDGLTWVKVIRKHEDRFEWNSGAPEVVDATGSVWSFEDDGEITNDSEAIVTVEVYGTSRPSIRGTRLKKVQVQRLAPRESRDDIPF